MILGLDTSLPIFSVALIDEGRVIGALMSEGKRSRNEKLLPAVDFLLTEAGRSPRDLSRIVVTRGPGSFTGVRIGLATAQGLAFASGAELWPVGTHLPVASHDQRTIVIGEAGRGEVYMSKIEQWSEPVEPELVDRDSVPDPGAHLVVIDIDEWSRKNNLALAAALHTSHDEVLPEPLTPLYVRMSAAEEKLRRGEL